MKVHLSYGAAVGEGREFREKAAWYLTNGTTQLYPSVCWRPPAKQKEFIRPISAAVVTKTYACALTQ